MWFSKRINDGDFAGGGWLSEVGWNSALMILNNQRKTVGKWGGKLDRKP